MARTPPRPSGYGPWRRHPSTVVRGAGVVPAATSGEQVILAQSEAAELPVEWETHSHPLHELVWVTGGSLMAHVGDEVFTVSEGVGLWIPAGWSHAGRLTARVTFGNAFFDPDRTPAAFEAPTAVTMTSLLGALLARLGRPDLPAAARRRSEAVVFDVLEASPRRLALRLPTDSRISAITSALLDDPAEDRALDQWARLLGVSERTITREFRRTTGLSFLQWRQALRVHTALTLLGDGHDVQATARRLGYAQPSTFIEAFGRVMGTTPGTFTGAGTRSA